MESNVIKVGNSKGIIIPAKILKILGFKNKVKMKVEDGKLLISPADKEVREGWEEMIAEEIEENGQPEKLLPDFFEDKENIDWKW